MQDADDFTLSLDSLFFDKPIVHKVKPLHHEASQWQLEAPPSLTHLPAIQDMQEEAETLSTLHSFTQKSRMFHGPLKEMHGFAVSSSELNSSHSEERETVETQYSSSSSPYTGEGLWSGEEFKYFSEGSSQSGRGGDETLLDTRNAPMSRWSSLDCGQSPSLRRSLFKFPDMASRGDSSTNNDLKSSSSSQTTSRPQTFVNQVAMTTVDPALQPLGATVGPAAPFPSKPPLLPPPMGSSAVSRRPLYQAPHAEMQDKGTKRAFVPPMMPQPLHIQGSTNSGVLRPVSEIPVKFRSIFSDFPFFNYVQSNALDDVLYSSKNFVACAPTGSGKTVLFELAIIRLLMETSEPWRDVKAVYMAPIKALCSQCFESWKKKFGPLGLNCKELTGDTEIDDFFEIHDSHIILTTPEKWDSMTRKWKDNCLLQLVRLFLIDEVHVVKDATRGATLEVVVSRMKAVHTFRTSQNPEVDLSMRFVAVSATIPNISDIADWLSNESGPATYLSMDESHRPVKLRKVVLGFPCSQNQTVFKFDLSLNYKMANIIQTYSDQKPTLVFCSTRKGAQQSATVLAKDARFIMSCEHKQRLMKYANSTLDSKLRDLVMLGIGYHHAGVDLSDRKLIEEAFTLGDLPVLFTTRTLAMGVNLPAHLVVIKSTMQYVAGSCEEYSEADILQMIGRAGRPQFDSSATAVIMTKVQTRDKYMKLVNGIEIIESSLHSHLVEHLNAEIVLQTISDVNMALDWIRSTFLYIRALKNPTHYGFSADLDRSGIEAKLQELCLKNLNALSSIDLISMDEDVNIKPTEAGRLMARFCVAFDTMKHFSKVVGTESLSDLVGHEFLHVEVFRYLGALFTSDGWMEQAMDQQRIRVFVLLSVAQVELVSKSREFSDIQLRVNERRTLNTLNRDKNRTTIRFPLEGKIKTSEMKVNCLIQAQMSSIVVQDFGLTQDTAKIFRIGMRISKCLSEFLSHQSKTVFTAVLNSLILAKSFRAKLWENSPYVSKQLEKIGQSLSTAMVNAGLTTFTKIEQTNPRELELIVNRHPPFGNQIRESVMHLPKYSITLEQLPRYSSDTAEIVVKVTLKNQAELQCRRTAPDHHYVSLVIGNSDNNTIYIQKLTDLLLLKCGSWSKKIEVAKASKGDDISVNVISSEYVGLDIQQKFSVYFSAAKTFGSETPCSLADTHTEQRLQHSAVKPPSANQKENIYTVNAQGSSGSKRQCNHFCKNKSVCAHDCCKVGVAVGQKRSVNHETSFSSYLKDLKNRSDALVQTPVKRLKMKMNEESLAVDMQKFAYKPKETLRPGSWRGKNEYINGYVDLTAEDCAQLSDVAGLDGLEQDSSAWRIPETNNGSLRSRQHLNHSNASQSVYSNWATASSKQEALGKTVPYAPTPAVTFDLGSEWDDWDDFDDENLLRASETAVPPCKTNPEHQLQQGDEYLPGYATTSAVSCPQASLPRTAVTTPLRSISASASSVIKKFESSSNTHAFTPKRLTLDLNKKKCNIFSDGLTLKTPQMFSEQPMGAQVNRRLDFFHTTVSSGINSSLNTGKEEEAFVGIFDGIF